MNTHVGKYIGILINERKVIEEQNRRSKKVRPSMSELSAHTVVDQVLEVIGFRLGAIVVRVVDFTVGTVEPSCSLFNALPALATALEGHACVAYLVVKNERRVTLRNGRPLWLGLWRNVYILLYVFNSRRLHCFLNFQSSLPEVSAGRRSSRN